MRISCRPPAPCAAGSRFNAVVGPPYEWTPDGTKLLVKVVPAGLGSVPDEPPAPSGPAIQDNTDGGATAAATFQDMIKSPHVRVANGHSPLQTTRTVRHRARVTHHPVAAAVQDEDLFAHCATASLVLLDLATGATTIVGDPAGMMLRGTHAPSNSSGVDAALALSPDGQFVLLQRLDRAGFSYVQQIGRFGHTTEVYSAATGERLMEVGASAVQEAVPTHNDSAVLGPRAFGW